jgi:hypothetical protein
MLCLLSTKIIPILHTIAASVLGGVWKDPNEPNWNKDIRFPPGSLTFKALMSDATDKELPFMRGSPEWQAVSL